MRIPGIATKDKLITKKRKEKLKGRNIFSYIFRITLGALFALALILSFFIGERSYKTGVKEGDISLRDIYSTVTFSYRGSVNEQETELRRKEAAELVEDIYRIDTELFTEVESEIAAYFKNISEILSQENILFPDFETLISEKSKIKLSNSALRILFGHKELNVAENYVKGVLEKIMSKGVIPQESFDKIIEDFVIVHDAKTKKEERKPVATFIHTNKITSEIGQLVSEIIPEERRLKSLVMELSEKFVRPNLIFDKTETERRKKIAIDSVPLIYNTNEVKRNELILAKGQKVTNDHIAKLNALNKLQAKGGWHLHVLGIVLAVALFMCVIILYLKYEYPKILTDGSKLTLIASLCVFIIILTKLIVESPLSSYLIPIAIVSMILSMLLNTQIALFITLILSVFIGIISGDKLSITYFALISGIVGVYSVRKVRRRSHILRAGLLVSLGSSCAIVTTVYLYNLGPEVLLSQSLWGFANGILSAVIVAGILPVFENLFHITTDVSLLELSDLNHPLLKEMAQKAPGTYHHSIIVGNLAEAACEAIGADALLARVGAYFHDIGKIEKAEYFSENQSKSESQHDKLAPTMSRLIITNHVKNGAEVAKKYKLNKVISDFILQHHGTGLVAYFYQQALAKTHPEEEIEEEGFRYPGPRPQSKETAVLLLADSVEAASRALSDPTPTSIKGLVRKIINNKFIDGQLDECELTLKDLDRIANAFVHVLTGIYHTRIEYPAEEEIASTKQKKKNNHNGRLHREPSKES